MKILHITETMASGVLKYLQEIAVVQNDSKAEHFIVYSAKRSFTPINLIKLFPVNVQLIDLDISMENYPGTLIELYKQIRSLRPDVIHLHSSIAGFFGRLVTLLFPNQKVFYTPHGYSFLMTNKPLLLRSFYWLTEFILSQLKGNIISCSLSEYRYAKKISLFRKVYLLENCTAPIRDLKQKSMQSKRIVVGVGRMEQQKDPLLFVEIIAELKQKDPTIKGVWIGDGSLRSECEKMNYLLKAEVTFTGWLSNEETLEYLKESAVFLQTSKWEGLPYSVLEAFAVGLPVVASDIPSHKDLIGVNYAGFIAGDKSQYVENVMTLLDNNGIAQKISEKNIGRLKRNYTVFSKKLYDIYYN